MGLLEPSARARVGARLPDSSPTVGARARWACYGAVSWADTRAVMGTRRGTRAGLVSCPREVHANAVGTCRGRP